MKNTKKSRTTQLEKRIKNFHKRWNINLSDNERWSQFRNRTINSFISTMYKEFSNKDAADIEFCNLMGIHHPQESYRFPNIFPEPKDLAVYNFFTQELNHKDLFLGIETLSWMESISNTAKEEFILELRSNIAITGIPIELKITNSKIITYPAGAKLLDEHLVNDNLDWLEQYPEAYKLFASSLSNIGIKGKERNVLDSLRLSLETLFKEILGNSKSLEKQQKELGRYLKAQGVNTEISNLYWLILDYYTKYQNKNVKHADNANPDEVEFLLYLTGTMMRLILKHTDSK